MTMNLAHRWLCNSSIWRKVVQRQIIPWALEGVELGEKILELGPGPGVTTECLRDLVTDLTCLEIDTKCASSLRHRMAPEGIRVIAADAASMPLADATFDAVVCFTMLHHVPSMVLQDRLLSEVLRVLRPGGVFVGTDSVSTAPFRLFHLFDRIEPVNPQTFSDRLRVTGFDEIQVDVHPHDFRFRAHKPTAKAVRQISVDISDE